MTAIRPLDTAPDIARIDTGTLAGAADSTP
jgi:hypothetical protein